MITINIKDVVIAIVIATVVHVSSLLSISLYILNKYPIIKSYDKEFDEFMYNSYHQAKGKQGYVKLVHGFDIVNNTLPFHNLTINPNEEGYCLGYCYFTKEVFNGTLMKAFKKHFKEVYNVSFLINSQLNIYTINEVRTGYKVKYEVLSSDEVKVFVYACNIPITDKNSVADDVFILFKLINGAWEYLYRPFIDRRDYYVDNNYNSYSLETVIYFI